MADGSTYVPRLRTLYDTEIRPALKQEFGYTNDMQIPRLDKIVLNMGVGEAVADTKKIKSAHDD
ncbi:MAG: 50S ribosomal protein L5, partial [Proteobacteria bacterium]|nr:50S ribosomal protein L5 [Pseudomonadota bacterium]